MGWVDDLEAFGHRLDSILPGPVYEWGRKIYRAYMRHPYLNAYRRRRDHACLWLRTRATTPPKTLHLGCGRNGTDMCDIDIIKTRATDYVLDARNLPFSDGSIERIETYHMVEHVPRDTLSQMFAEWARALKPGGELVVELPDFDRVVTEYLETDDPDYTETLLRYVYGSGRFTSDHHYWGWNGERLATVLQDSGFENIVEREPTDYHADEAPCLRLEANAKTKRNEAGRELRQRNETERVNRE